MDHRRFRLLEPILEPIVGRAIPLPAPLADAFPELGRVRWRRGGLPPRVAGWFLWVRSVAAVTLWDTVWLSPGTPMHPALLLHELRHVHQFGASRLFPLAYAWESIRRGYRRNRYEVDADRWSTGRLRDAGGAHPPSQDV